MNARKLTLVVLCTALGGMALTSASVLAAEPETPETTAATGVAATSATLNGVLNPGKAEGEAGTFHFRYYASSISCEYAEGPGTQETPQAPTKATGKK